VLAQHRRQGAARSRVGALRGGRAASRLPGGALLGGQAATAAGRMERRKALLVTLVMLLGAALLPNSTCEVGQSEPMTKNFTLLTSTRCQSSSTVKLGTATRTVNSWPGRPT
jgi:hypothetical protein